MRATTGVGRVEKIQEVAGLTDGLPTFNGVAQCSVQDRSRDGLIELGGDVANGFEQSVELESRFCGGKNNGGVTEEEKFFLNPLTEFTQCGEDFIAVIASAGSCFASGDFFFARHADGFLQQIPFVDDNDAGFVRGDNFIGDFLFLFGDPIHSIDDEQDDVCAQDGFLGAFDAEEFDGGVHAVFFAQSCGVDEQITLPDAVGHNFEGNIDGVARGASDGADDDAFGLGECVDDG
ncbi:MAG: hypothetical protein JW388_0115 [Nitrospira sp.]|nr:hypothetical protein [Nitrospira sp.]